PEVDVISGWRKERQDRTVSRKLPSAAANAVISSVTGVKLHDYGCALKLYRADVIRGLRLYGELHRFIPALAAQVRANLIRRPLLLLVVLLALSDVQLVATGLMGELLTRIYHEPQGRPQYLLRRQPRKGS